jgi:hypothetical protein
MLCDLPVEVVERAMVQARPEAIMIIAKAIGLRAAPRGISAQELEQCLGTCSRLKRATAEQIVAFQRKRSKTR